MAKELVNVINKKYVDISNRMTKAYEKVLSMPCDLYFPIYDPYNETTKYREMKIFAPHQSPTYSKEPDVKGALFYIPFLIKKEAMNSSETEFDSFYTEGESERPYIETSKKRELPISTKVVVHQGQSIMKFFVDKKLVVTGADGMMLLRMYLAPLAKDDDEEGEEQKETVVEGNDYSPSTTGDGLGATLGASRSIEAEVIEDISQNMTEIQEEKPKKKRGRKPKAKVKENAVAEVTSSLSMNIPED